MRQVSCALLVALSLIACRAPRDSFNDIPVEAARLKAHVTYLASDALQGRQPGTPAEAATVAYVARQFAAAGLCPAWSGQWLQPVPMLETAPQDWRLSIRDAAGNVTNYGKESLVLYSNHGNAREEISDSRLVFVGYGIDAPDLGRNDYDRADVRGSTLLMLAGTPDDAAFHDADARYRYGFGPNKAAEAARRGAAAILIIAPDGSSWEQAAAAARATRRSSADVPAGASHPAIEGRLPRQVAAQLIGTAASLQELEMLAAQHPSRAVALNLFASAQLTMQIRRFSSSNVIGILPGAERPLQHIAFLAHWDHLGLCAPDVAADRICNGAVDNASGVASLIELARVLAAGRRLRRSVVFLALTGEESGMLGSRYYVAHPALPLSAAVGGATLDMTAGRARGTDAVLFGKGFSDIDGFFEAAARVMGRNTALPRPDEASYLLRSDNLPFLTHGVPVLTLSGLWSEGPGREDFDRYLADRYHQPSDESGAIVDFEGAAEDADLLRVFAQNLANSDAWPTWQPQSPFQRLKGDADAAISTNTRAGEWATCAHK